MVPYGVQYPWMLTPTRGILVIPPISPRLFLEPRLPLVGASVSRTSRSKYGSGGEATEVSLRWMEVCETQAAQPSSVVRTGQSSDRQGRWASATPFGLAGSDAVLEPPEPPLFLPTARTQSCPFVFCPPSTAVSFALPGSFMCSAHRACPQASLSSAFGPPSTTLTRSNPSASASAPQSVAFPGLRYLSLGSHCMTFCCLEALFSALFNS